MPKNTENNDTSTPPNLNLACPQASPKPRSKLNDSKEMLTQVLLCSIECTKSNLFLPRTHVGFRISKGVQQMIIYPQVLDTNSCTRGG